jgi:RNA polymerase sigma-70 factor (ECF subfamily)
MRDLEQIYTEHGWHVFRRARTILGNEDEAWDVCQDVFLKLAEAGETIRDRSRTTAWLFRVTTNRCIDRLRTRKPHRPDEVDRLLAGGDAEGQTAARELVARLANTFPAEVLELAVLRYVDGLTMEELEEVSGMTRKTAAKHLARFRKRAEALLSTTHARGGDR